MSEPQQPEHTNYLSPTHSHTKSLIPASPSDTLEMKKFTNVKPFHLNAKIIEALQNLTPKRDFRSFIGDAVSPIRPSCRTKKNLDMFSSSIEGIKRSNRPSISSTIYSDASTKGGTSSLSRLTVKTLQSPKSISGLPLEGQSMTTTNLQMSKTLEKSLIEMETKPSPRESHSKIKTNAFNTNREETFEDLLGIRQETMRFTNQKVVSEKLSESHHTEESCPQGGFFKPDSRDNELEPTIVQKQEDNLVVEKRSKKVTPGFNRMNRIKKCRKEASQEGQLATEPSVTGVNGEYNKAEGSSMLLEPFENSERFKLLSTKGSKTSSSRTRRKENIHRSKDGGSSIFLKTFSESELASPQQQQIQMIRKEVEEEPNVINIGNKAIPIEILKGEQSKKVEYEKLGRKGMMMKRLRSKNQDQKPEETDNTPNQDKSNGSRCFEGNKKEGEKTEDGLQQTEREAEISQEETRKAKRPKLRRMKSEFYRQALLSKTEEDQSVKTMRVLQDISEDKQEQDPKFLLFKQGSHNFFEFNVENKYVQTYDLMSSVQETILAHKTNISSEKTSIKANLETEPSDETKNVGQEKQSEGSKGLKTSKSEKWLDPSTMIVRYYDEMQPLAIQPKFMQTTGSMCITELWSNKNKQDFYKKMRKPLQSNTILCLNPQTGLYRPEKSINSELQRYRRIRREKKEKREGENTSMSITSFLTENSGLMQHSRTSKHTRAFVLQGGSSETRPKRSSRGNFAKDCL